MARHGWWTAGLLVLGVAACGGRTPFYLNGNGGGNSNTNLNGNGNGNTNGNLACGGADDCTMARRVDQCCSCPQPASWAEIDAERCLVPLVQSSIPPDCWVDCSNVDCAACPPLPEGVTCDAGTCVWDEPEACVDEDCVIGIRVDECCTQGAPVSRAELDEDPCLVFFPPLEIPPLCRERWEVNCDWINCTWSPPESRNAACAGGGCESVAECATDSDCGLAVNGRQCCGCPEGWPAEMLGRDPCIVDAGDPVPQFCPMMTCLADCPPCQDAMAYCNNGHCDTHHDIPW